MNDTSENELSLPAAQPWGLGEAAAGWIVAVTLGAILGGIIVSAAGYSVANGSDDLPLWLIAITQVPLWVGLVGAPLYAVRSAGHSLRADFGFSIKWIDVPMGIVIGLFCQLVLVPVVSTPWLHVLGKSAKDLSAVADKLTSKATDPLGVVLLILIVAIGAPIIEELFYRGLLLRALDVRLPRWGAIVLCGVIFGASHFEALQFPALAAFGMVLAYVAMRTGRLGPSIMAHLAFNSFTVVYLLR